MFDRCRKWRRRLTQRSEGTLPINRWGALDAHLARCARCRAADEADRALRETLSIHIGLPGESAAQQFDERVLINLRKPAVKMAPTESVIPLEFLRQLLGGAFVAASLTILCLFTTLHTQPTNSIRKSASSENAHWATRNEPPVPLESLLETPSPRAALLWTVPTQAPADRKTHLAPRQTRPTPIPPPDTPPGKRMNRRDALPVSG